MYPTTHPPIHQYPPPLPTTTHHHPSSTQAEELGQKHAKLEETQARANQLSLEAAEALADFDAERKAQEAMHSEASELRSQADRLQSQVESADRDREQLGRRSKQLEAELGAVERQLEQLENTPLPAAPPAMACGDTAKVVEEMEARLMRLAGLIRQKDQQIDDLREVVHAECRERAALLAHSGGRDR